MNITAIRVQTVPSTRGCSATSNHHVTVHIQVAGGWVEVIKDFAQEVDHTVHEQGMAEECKLQGVEHLERPAPKQPPVYEVTAHGWDSKLHIAYLHTNRAVFAGSPQEAARQVHAGIRTSKTMAGIIELWYSVKDQSTGTHCEFGKEAYYP